MREVLNAIRYLARSGDGWRMLPKDFPPWPTVYWWFRRFVRRFLFQTIHDVALMLDRERVGREASPTGGVIDSQSVKDVVEIRPHPRGDAGHLYGLVPIQQQIVVIEHVVTLFGGDIRSKEAFQLGFPLVAPREGVRPASPQADSRH